MVEAEIAAAVVLHSFFCSVKRVEVHEISGVDAEKKQATRTATGKDSSRGCPMTPQRRIRKEGRKDH